LKYSLKKNNNEFLQLKKEIAALRRTAELRNAERLPFEPQTLPVVEDTVPATARRQNWPENYPSFSNYVIETKMTGAVGATLASVGDFIYD